MLSPVFLGSSKNSNSIDNAVKMLQHRYNTRSKAPSCDLVVGGNIVPVKIKTSQPSATGQPDHRKGSKQIKLQETGAVSMPITSEPAEDTPKLITLPAELQTIIYQPLLFHFEWIWIRMFMASRTEKTVRWQVETRVQGRQRSRPALLSVCKYLRSFATPLYLAGNTFAMASADWDDHKIGLLRKMWGEEDVKQIREVQYMIEVDIRYICFSKRGYLSLEKTEDVRVAIHMHLLRNGTLVLSVRSDGTIEYRTLPSGAICHCKLEKIATNLHHQGGDNRRLFEMMAECEKYDKATASVQKCPRCNLSALINIKLRR